MSHHSDDNMLIATSDSFWEPGNYKRTTKRIEDGHKLCDSLIALVQERAEIEKSYAKALKNWSKNWNDKIEKGPEYGTTEAAWKGVLVESERLCDLHLRVKENLCNDIIHQVKTWQKETYHKSMMTLKERKEMEDAFKKAQKPWAKLLQKVEKAKSEYHNSCKTERTAANMERNASADSSLSPDQVKKMQDRVQKTKEEVQKAKEKYEAALQEINQYNPKYMEDMTQVFEKCQEMEAQRLQFFKDVLFGIHKCLNISQDPILPQIYEEFYHTVNNADHEKDLKWWSNNHGVNMAMNWPQFEDYTEEFRDITKGSKSKEALPAGSITLINQRPVGEDVHEYPPVNNKSKSKPSSRVISTDGGHGDSKTDTMNSSKHSSEKNNHDGNAVNRTSTMTNGTNVKQESNPFEEEEWDEDSGEPLVDNGEPGVLVRALYDYEGAEADELSFKQGDVFDKLEDEDEQGWCKGRKDGRVGLYPANYVELVSP
ncbi:protein kinase C and casein kinase substrate in neurons protein 2 isoform X3 [Bombus vosnesenskii]|uniref:Protein kinase C and casein kinase substrate in neurons protein 2 isoform X3 n=4 Tax=Bombus TaxID=28641 RepID=A0A6J3K6C7_9HYME|nr:protein kinase C and casein kinase substrate in neurons protein 2 isoform X3 [Bombus impatiens]XP_033189855.1 protein kinase C and casein kinase substrate in neurons protein 2 isoform X3 [Bombus vancouverensis nearcticus]XP_033301254.1 protein kinase C and casein kinase substrate in neurons protein 2 isoform X3 [Bombus bifarius]XP_033348623.1 protein kinase C and casein kinase substrate in neurons protein 2 isoform X3 [Bombus vosnesenskii]XP_043595150.1 protein kinase C and casein kinase sub